MKKKINFFHENDHFITWYWALFLFFSCVAAMRLHKRQHIDTTHKIEWSSIFSITQELSETKEESGRRVTHLRAWISSDEVSVAKLKAAGSFFFSIWKKHKTMKDLHTVEPTTSECMIFHSQLPRPACSEPRWSLPAESRTKEPPRGRTPEWWSWARTGFCTRPGPYSASKRAQRHMAV